MISTETQKHLGMMMDLCHWLHFIDEETKSLKVFNVKSGVPTPELLH